jgi:hypothetical protein
MGISWAKIGGTQFTAYMAILNLSTSLGTKIAGPLEAVIGTEQLFLMVPLCSLLALVPLVLIDPYQTKRVFGGADPTAAADVAPGPL